SRAATPRTSRPGGLPSGGEPRRILIVDDNEDARMLLADVLAMLGHRVETAGDGVAALKLAADFAPEVAILDIGLPVMDGYELAPPPPPELPTSTPRLTALPGFAQQRDRDRSAEAGFDVHLVKPVDVKRLIRSISPEG